MTQVDICYDILRNLIIGCEIPPGARLTERDLIAKLGFGRTPVREALLRLDHDRLVDTMPRSGYRVRPLTRKSIDDFFIAWRAVAPLMVRLAFERMDDETRRRIDALEEVQAALSRGDVDGNSRVAGTLFELLATAADSEYLAFIFHRFGAEMERLFRIFFGTPEGQAWMAGQSQLRVLATIEKPEVAADRVSHALKVAHRSILAVIDRFDAEGWPFEGHGAEAPDPKVSRGRAAPSAKRPRQPNSRTVKAKVGKRAGAPRAAG